MSDRIWFRPYTVADVGFFRDSLPKHLGIEFTEIGADFLRGRMPVDERTKQPYGILHGGASVALAETLGSTAAGLVVDPDKYRVVGQEINANHVRDFLHNHLLRFAGWPSQHTGPGSSGRPSHQVRGHELNKRAFL